MTDDLDTLRPEVWGALAEIYGETICRCHESYTSRGMKDPDCNHDIRESVDTIRAELLRLNRENAELRRAWGDTLLTGTGILKVERIDPATVMLPVEPRPGNETPVPKSEWEALTERAERAEAELAALKARVAWQPIETAPRDGRFMLLARDRVFFGFYRKVSAGWCDHSCMDRDPSHWMPMPAPPERVEG